MSTKNVSAKAMNSSNGLADVAIIDATSTKGKVSSKFNLNNLAELEEKTSSSEIEKISKNELFKENGILESLLCPISYDWKEDESLKALVPMVEKGIISIETIQPTIDTARKAFFDRNKDVIEEYSKMTFEQVIEKIASDKKVYKRLLEVCNLSEFNKDNYISENGTYCIIYHNTQKWANEKDCTENGRKGMYKDISLKETYRRNDFIIPLFVEEKEVNTKNILNAIRYYSLKTDAEKSLSNAKKEFFRTDEKLQDVAFVAKSKGYTLDEIIEQVTLGFERDDD